MEEKMDCAWEAYQAYSNYCGQVPKEWPGLRTVEAWTAAVAPLVARLEKAEKLNEFFRESVGECHLMVSRDTPEYQGDKKHWESTTLPPRVSGLIAERNTFRAKLEKAEREREEWKSRAHALDSRIFDAHVKAFGSRNYAYTDPESTLDLLVADVGATVQERDALRAKVGELEAGLEPFARECESTEREAEVASSVGGYVPVDMPELSIDGWAAHGIKWADLLRARDLLCGLAKPEGRDDE